ncbi:hypothetical protein F4Y93_12365 [Candidatus Poribacteria bacterium]|nr:hypothetical protein [Candidatus Poribacteria bacterium]
MKMICVLLILFGTIVLPVLGALDDADLNQIRLIVQKEIEPIKDDIEGLKIEVATLSGHVSGIEKMMTWLMVLIVVAVGLPQIIIAWRSRKDRSIEKQIEVLTQEIETLKQRQIVQP